MQVQALEPRAHVGAGQRIAIAFWIACTTGSGVAAGTMARYITSCSSCGRPASATVGMSGASVERLRLVTASGVILPALTCGSMPGVASTPPFTSPASTAVTAGVLPL